MMISNQNQSLQRLQRPDVQSASLVLLDGFPRTSVQARTLSRVIKIDRVVLLQLPDHLCLQRCLHRKVDPDTDFSYHDQFMPAPAHIAPRLMQRQMDKSESLVMKRLAVFHANLAHVLQVFKGKLFAGNLYEILFWNFVVMAWCNYFIIIQIFIAI